MKEHASAHDALLARPMPAIRPLPYLSTYSDLEANFGWKRTRSKSLARRGEIEVIHDGGRAFFLTESVLSYIERLRSERIVPTTAPLEGTIGSSDVRSAAFQRSRNAEDIQ